jgi:hypothetical protein
MDENANEQQDESKKQRPLMVTLLFGGIAVAFLVMALVTYRDNPILRPTLIGASVLNFGLIVLLWWEYWMGRTLRTLLIWLAIWGIAVLVTCVFMPPEVGWPMAGVMLWFNAGYPIVEFLVDKRRRMAR